MKKKIDLEVSSGNVFADLGFSDAEEMLAKAELARQINGIIKKKKLTQKAAASLLDVDQPKVSLLAQGKLAGFSLERLFRFLNILGQSITINVMPKSKSKKQLVVSISLPKRVKKTVITSKTSGIERRVQAKKRK